MDAITRVGFCQECYDSNRPNKKQAFLTLGNTGTYHFCEVCMKNAKRGMTPHLYRARKVVDNIVFYETLCTMCNCGTILVEEKDRDLLKINPSKWSNWKRMTLKSWEALYFFTDTGFKI